MIHVNVIPCFPLGPQGFRFPQGFPMKIVYACPSNRYLCFTSLNTAGDSYKRHVLRYEMFSMLEFKTALTNLHYKMVCVTKRRYRPLIS